MLICVAVFYLCEVDVWLARSWVEIGNCRVIYCLGGLSSDLGISYKA